jgi:hypothetical protein
MGFYGILAPASWWRPLAVVFAVVSLVGLIVFGRAWPIFSFISVIVMNVAVLAALLWLN